MGFTESEVELLCHPYSIDLNVLKEWYDGYHLDECSIYSPKSVITAIHRRKFGYYWTETENFEALKVYIDMNFDDLKENVIEMLAGKEVFVDTGAFQNDMVTFHSKDDVFTLLIHLGYDSQENKVYIPNKEVVDSFV